MAEMTGRERFLIAIRGQEPDRVPVAPRIAYFLREYYGDAGWEAYVRGGREFGWDNYITLGAPLPNFLHNPTREDYSILEPDVQVEVTKRLGEKRTYYTRVFHTPAGTLRDVSMQPDPDAGSGIAPNPHRDERLIKDLDGIDRIQYVLPDPQKTNMAPFHRCRQAVGDTGVISVAVHSCIDHKAGVAMDIEDMMLLYYDDREALLKLFGVFHRHAMEETKVYLEAGVEIIRGTWFYASLSAGWSPAIYHEIFEPMLREHIDLVHSYGGIYHLYDDGACMPLIETWRDCGVDIVSTLTPPPMGDVDLRVVKEKVGADCCLRGYIDHMNTVTFGTPETIREAVREAISIAAPGGGFILGTCDSIRDGTPPENVHAYCRAAAEFGTYPIST